MSLHDYHVRDRTITNRIIDAIYKLIAERGVPTDFDETWELAKELVPLIANARQQYYRISLRYIDDFAKTNGVKITPAPPHIYDSNAAWKMMARALGWNPNKQPIPNNINDYDEATQKQIAEKVIPFPDDPHDPEIVEAVSRRIAAGAVRHVRAAGREAVIETAELNKAQKAKPAPKPPREKKVIVIDLTEEEAEAARRDGRDPGKVREDQYVYPTKKGGVELGWARVLTGGENCVFCAMLASRGPVYKKQTALTAGERSEREGKSFHDNCDCKAVLVVKGRKWEGEEQFKALQDLWDNARDKPTEEEKEKKLHTTLDRFSDRYRKKMAEDDKQFSAFDEDASNTADGKEEKLEAGVPSEDAGTGLAGSVFEEPGPDGNFVLPEEDGFPEEKLHPLYGRGLDEYPRLDVPETMEEAATQTARVHSFANCVRATAAAVMRMKGYDVHPYASLYSSSKDGLQILQALEMWETEAGPVKAIETTADAWEGTISAIPDGSYGVFSFEVDQLAQRHVILWRKAADGMVFVDPQQGDEPVIFGQDFDIYPKASVVIARLDNADPVESKAEDVILPFTTQEV